MHKNNANQISTDLSSVAPMVHPYLLLMMKVDQSTFAPVDLGSMERNAKGGSAIHGVATSHPQPTNFGTGHPQGAPPPRGLKSGGDAICVVVII
jgi:hypothetical protein